MLSSLLGPMVWKYMVVQCPLIPIDSKPSNPKFSEILLRRTTTGNAWWNEKLNSLRKRIWKVFNKAKISGGWEAYYKTLTQYNREVRRAQKDPWWIYCQEVVKSSVVSKLCQNLGKASCNPIVTLRNERGVHTTSV